MIIVIDGDKWHSNQIEKMNLQDDSAKNLSCDATMKKISQQRGALSVVVGGLKRAVTMFAKVNQIQFAWQTRFYDRIIRNQMELNQTAIYINQNVAKWYEDEYNAKIDNLIQK